MWIDQVKEAKANLTLLEESILNGAVDIPTLLNTSRSLSTLTAHHAKFLRLLYSSRTACSACRSMTVTTEQAYTEAERRWRMLLKHWNEHWWTVDMPTGESGKKPASENDLDTIIRPG